MFSCKGGQNAFELESGEKRWTIIRSQAILAVMQCGYSARHSEYLKSPMYQSLLQICSAESTCNQLCHDPLKAVRVGEASNPGPKKQRTKMQSSQAVVAIINPTAIRNKHDEFNQLINTYQVNTFCCAETSATAEVQQTMQYQFHNSSYPQCGHTQ